MLHARIASALASSVLLAAAGGAQSLRGSIAGVVIDTAGSRVPGVDVNAVGAGLRTRSGGDGTFALAGVPFGPLTLEARRLGFRPETVAVTVSSASATTVTFRLRPIAERLETVEVKGSRPRYTGRLAGYHERLAASTGGYFITRARIDQQNPRQLTDLLRNVPGIEVTRSRVRMRSRTCAPLIWLDGFQMPAGEVDLNTFPPRSIEGIEVYTSATGAPSRYQGTRDQSRCGTILLWSRGADTELGEAPPPGGQTAAIRPPPATRAVFTADEVDVGAHLAGGTSFAVDYPAELFAARTSGLVVAEFVVDTAGRAEAGSFGVMSSSHPLFAAAVESAVRGAPFEPARVAGRAVRQLVRMQFRFEPPQGRR
ncbi:MAG TPA: TonB family protein [Gemmatimonadaceae bacterium]|nr:TonB family protein [Gemmatimonadaceae bacterium]